MAKLLDSCAHDLMETAPNIMQTIRGEMRRGHGTDLSIPQFRALRFIQRNPDSSLSDLASHLGLTPPSVSKLVDGLVKQELIGRQESFADRRRLMLVLTHNGESIINTARASTQANLVKILSFLSNEELNAVHLAMEILHPLFVPQIRQQPAKEY
jgi:MarR family transcriptional regulator for hemolysin